MINYEIGYYMWGFISGCSFCLIFTMALNALIQIRNKTKETQTR